MALGEKQYIGDAGVCPFCHGDWVLERGAGRQWCLICNIAGTWTIKNGIKVFKPDSGATPRWDAEGCRAHFDHLILSSKKRYRDQKADLIGKAVDI